MQDQPIWIPKSKPLMGTSLGEWPISLWPLLHRRGHGAWRLTPSKERPKTGLEAAPGPLARATLLLGFYGHLVLLCFSLGSQRFVRGLRCGSSQGSWADTTDLPRIHFWPSPMPSPLQPAPLPHHGGLHLGETPETAEAARKGDKAGLTYSPLLLRGKSLGGR